MRLRKNIFGIQTEDEQIRLIAHEAATASAFFGGKYAGGEQCTRFLHLPPKKDIFCCRFIGENYPGSLQGKCRLDCSALEFYNRNRSRKLCGSSHILVKFAGWRDPNQFFFCGCGIACTGIQPAKCGCGRNAASRAVSLRGRLQPTRGIYFYLIVP